MIDEDKIDFSFLRAAGAVPPPPGILTALDPLSREIAEAAAPPADGVKRFVIPLAELLAFIGSVLFEVSVHYVSECVEWAIEKIRNHKHFRNKVIGKLAAGLPESEGYDRARLAAAIVDRGTLAHRTPAWYALYPGAA